MKRLTANFKVVAFAALSAWALMAMAPAAMAEDDDRPIKVPRGGGKITFTQYCTTCHMPDGRGGQNEGGYGADLRKTPLDVDMVVHTIANGRAGRGMPAFKGLIDEENIRLVAEFIKTDAPNGLKLK
ncbi:MAG: c-type cytochrome [bacterium]|jgi:mono/diheme cytochrome c family protein|nr:cytochrome c [Oxalobacteraceae bacterium]